MKGKSRVDAIFTVKRISDGRQKFNYETHLPFVDLTKAFENVKRTLSWQFLDKRG